MIFMIDSYGVESVGPIYGIMVVESEQEATVIIDAVVVWTIVFRDHSCFNRSLWEEFAIYTGSKRAASFHCILNTISSSKILRTRSPAQGPV